jgi:hypothetical protein
MGIVEERRGAKYWIFFFNQNTTFNVFTATAGGGGGSRVFGEGNSETHRRRPLSSHEAVRKLQCGEQSHEGVSKSFRTGRLERELQMVQLSATRWSCIAILWVSLVSFTTITLFVTSQVSSSSVGIALGYGLDDRGSRVRFPTGAGNFSLHHRVHNGSGAHPASYPMGTSGSFPRGKAAGAWS